MSGIVAFIAVVIVSAVFTQKGQSPTYRLMQIQVVDLNGAPASLTRMALRNVAHLVDVASIGLGFLWPIWDNKGQAFADKLASTQVRRVH